MLKRILLVWLALVPAVASAANTSREVWAMTDNYGDPTALLVALKSQLQHHPRATRFHISWSMAEPHGANGGLLIYDRTQEKLWISQSQSGNWPVDEKEDVFNVSEDTQQWMFRRVTLHRLSLLFHKYLHAPRNAHFDDISYEVSFFPRLGEFGAQGGLLRRTSEHWHERSVDGKRVRVP